MKTISLFSATFFCCFALASCNSHRSEEKDQETWDKTTDSSRSSSTTTQRDTSASGTNGTYSTTTSRISEADSLRNLK